MDVMATKTCRVMIFICLMYLVLPNASLGQTNIPKSTGRTMTDSSQANKDDDTDSSIPSPILGSVSRQSTVIPKSQQSSVLPTKESTATIRTSRGSGSVSTSGYNERVTTDGNFDTSTSTPVRKVSGRPIGSTGLPHSESVTKDTTQKTTETHLDRSTSANTTNMRPITKISGRNSNAPGIKQDTTTDSLPSPKATETSSNQQTTSKILTNYTSTQPTGTLLTNTTGNYTDSGITEATPKLTTTVISTTKPKSSPQEYAKTQKQIGSVTTHSTVVDETNSTHSYINTSVDTDTDRLQISITEDEFDSGDRLWPVAMALIIGLPTIIVLGIAITVLYRGRLAKPRSMLAMYGENYAQM